MGLRSFLVHEDPLSVNRLKLSDRRQCEELEFKSLIGPTPPHSHPHENGRVNGYATTALGGAGGAGGSRPAQGYTVDYSGKPLNGKFKFLCKFEWKNFEEILKFTEILMNCSY